MISLYLVRFQTTDLSHHNHEDSLDIEATDTVDSTQREICFLLFTKFSKEVCLMFYGNICYGVIMCDANYSIVVLSILYPFCS